MLEDKKDIQKNLKDSITSIGIALKDSQLSLPYNKTNKLVSALYMVTDIMDKEEPLRSKLRNLGTNIVSDIHSIQQNRAGHIMSLIPEKVAEILSFLEIASSVSIISEMNCSILTKEFIELRKSIIEITPKNEQVWLQEFMKEDETLGTNVLKRGALSIGQTGLPAQAGTRIGVQRGGTLLQALSRVEVSDRIPFLSKTAKVNNNNIIKSESIDVLKNKRREEIISIIKDKMKDSTNFNGVTITDIKSKGQGVLASCGGKTLQRELISMVLDNILKKTGEKRWSKYLLFT